jgi:nuclear pore complex protein Nup62
MFVCMYVYIFFVCVYVRVRICVCICLCIYLCVCMYICMCVILVYMYVCVDICIYVYICMYVCIKIQIRTQSKSLLRWADDIKTKSFFLWVIPRRTVILPTIYTFNGNCMITFRYSNIPATIFSPNEEKAMHVMGRTERPGLFYYSFRDTLSFNIPMLSV